MKLRTVDTAAARILEQLTAGLEPGQSKKFDNALGAFMPVSVECLHWSAVGTHFSVTHYFEQNGDLVPDPDVELVRLTDGRWIPLAYQDARAYRRAAIVEGDQLKVARAELNGLVTFVNTWICNIKEQQGLSRVRWLRPSVGASRGRNACERRPRRQLDPRQLRARTDVR